MDIPAPPVVALESTVQGTKRYQDRRSSPNSYQLTAIVNRKLEILCTLNHLQSQYCSRLQHGIVGNQVAGEQKQLSYERRSSGKVDIFLGLSKLLSSQLEQYTDVVKKGLALQRYYAASVLSRTQASRNNKQHNQLCEDFLRLKLENQTLAREVKVTEATPKILSKSRVQNYIFAPPKNHPIYSSKKAHVHMFQHELRKLQFSLFIKMHKNKTALTKQRADLTTLRREVDKANREVIAAKDKISRQLNRQYTQLIDAEARVANASIGEAKALMKRKVHLMSDKMARDFDHKLEANAKALTDEVASIDLSLADTLDKILLLRSSVEGLQREIRSKQSEINNGNADISDVVLLDDNCEIVQNMEQAQATLVEMRQNEIQRGHVIKQRSRKIWNNNNVKSKYILEFLWRATGGAFSKAALHLTNQEIKRVEQNRGRPDGLWVGSLRNSSSMEELKDHRNSFLQRKYNFLKKREKHLKHAEQYTWENGLRE